MPTALESILYDLMLEHGIDEVWNAVIDVAVNMRNTEKVAERNKEGLMPPKHKR